MQQETVELISDLSELRALGHWVVGIDGGTHTQSLQSRRQSLWQPTA